MRLAVIGAGIAGLAAGALLSQAGLAPVIFEKGRGPGGRMSSKRTEQGSIDLGAQYFTAQDSVFKDQVADWINADVAAEWAATPMVLPERQPARAQRRFVASPKMSSIAKHLAKDLDVHTQVQVAEIARELTGWVLRDRTGQPVGDFDYVLITAPAPQAQSLLAEPSPALAAQAASVRMKPCWSLGLILGSPTGAKFDAGFPSSGPLGWVARSGSRPSRESAPEMWILHATAEWSQTHIEASAESVTTALIDAFSALHPGPLEVADTVVHRWRFARAASPLGEANGFLEGESGLLCAGDWVTDGRVEGAWHSGRAAALRLIDLARGQVSPSDAG